MGIHIEAIILYILLFLSGMTARFSGFAAQTGDYSIILELAKITLYTIPALALIWYLLLRTWKLEYWVIRPGRKDIACVLVTLPCLLVTGIVIQLVSSAAGSSASQTAIQTPSSVFGWIVLVISCMLLAYLEESFFRFYLFTRRQELNLSDSSMLVLSTALFAICHIAGGPWGFLNAAISGALLGFMFLRYNSFHGIAAAHGLYNIFIYIVNALIN